MAALTSLPADLLFMITSYLGNQKDILNLASTTRALYALLYTHAFTSLRLDDESHYQLTRLTHVLATNPECARAVRILQFEPSVSHEPSDVPVEEHVKYDGGVIRPILERLVSALVYPSDATKKKKDTNNNANENADATVAKWEASLKEGNEIDLWVALALSLVPGVEELSLTFSYGSFYIRKLVSAVTLVGPDGQEPPFNLSRLRTLSARWCDTENGVRYRERRALLIHPPLLPTALAPRIQRGVHHRRATGRRA
jgi:hypothetical protein